MTFIKKWLTRILVFIGLLTVISVLAAKFMHKDLSRYREGNVAHVRIEGPIICGSEAGALFSSRKEVTSDSIIKLLEDIKENPKIRAVLFEINSPGGSPVASEEIARAILELNLPTVAWIRETGASGAYWVAMATSWIVAHPLSITGSIGVLANSFGFEDLLQTLKLKYRRQVAGNMKDIGSPFREPTPEEQTYLQGVLNQIHQVFIDAFSKARKIPPEKAKELATGIFYTGLDAKEKNLVDALGGKKEALAWLKKTIKEPVILVDYEGQGNFMETLLGGVTMEGFGTAFASGFIRQWAKASKKVNIES